MNYSNDNNGDKNRKIIDNGEPDMKSRAEFREDLKYSIDNGHEGFESAWKARMQEIDGYITQFMHEADELSSEMIDDLTENVGEWWEKQPMSDKARAEWAKMKADGKVLRARVEQRLTHLVEDGKLKWKEMTHSEDK